MRTQSVDAELQDNRVAKVSVRQALGKQVTIKTDYVVDGDGEIRVQTRFSAAASLPPLVRLGMQVGVSGDYVDIEYYGKGPWENYVDRNRSAEISRYTSAIRDMPDNYVMPQENGNRTETRWIKLTGKPPGIAIEAEEPLGFSIWPWSAENIEQAKHSFDLVDQGFYTLNIDHRQMGVGGDDSWSPRARPMEKYRVPAGKYDWAFTIKPIR